MVTESDIPKSHVNCRSEDYDDYDSDEPFLDNEDYYNGNPIPNNEDYDKNSDRQSLDNKDCDEDDDKGDIETESDCSKTSAYISEENDELTDDDKEFEESEMTNINDDELIQGEEEIYADIFDGLLYKDLLQRDFFKDDRDIALSGTCDGYQIFEQRTDDCWRNRN
ncbi:hypothetical protein GLOIN_2v1482231 [Rhizophagus clarus]|uniref:Uncharacterized protein n=1 Tax=Rhizophagus clarus TaxID=94130 RepID=A0A8H3MHN4_9GLOM|nr:hypothetical protein GLOIN_2v1482231 [Rhizophagus clarus]